MKTREPGGRGGVTARVMRFCLTLCGTVAVLAGPARSDVLIPGDKAVVHELVLEFAQEFDGMRFVAFPTRGLGGLHEVVPGEPFRFSSKYGTRIYLMQPGEPWPENGPREATFLAAHPHGIPCTERNRAFASSPLARIVSTYRVDGAADNALQFTLQEELQLDARGNPLGSVGLWPLLLVIAVLGAGGLVALAGRPEVACTRRET